MNRRLVDDYTARGTAPLLPTTRRSQMPRPLPSARIVEPDALLRIHAIQAASDLGFGVLQETSRPAANEPSCEIRFLGLDRLDSCPRCASLRVQPLTAEPRHHSPLTVGYVSGPECLVAVHAIHACTDVILRLTALNGRATFAYARSSTPVTTSIQQLTHREADVLLCLLAGETTDSLAMRLTISHATARAHCRAVLRKLDAPSRRDLRARLLGRCAD